MHDDVTALLETTGILTEARGRQAASRETERRGLLAQLQELQRDAEVTVNKLARIVAAAETKHRAAAAAAEAALAELLAARLAQLHASNRQDAQSGVLEHRIRALASPSIAETLAELRRLEEETRFIRPIEYTTHEGQNPVTERPNLTVATNQNEILARLTAIRAAIREVETLPLSPLGGDELHTKLQSLMRLPGVD